MSTAEAEQPDSTLDTIDKFHKTLTSNDVSEVNMGVSHAVCALTIYNQKYRKSKAP